MCGGTFTAYSDLDDGVSVLDPGWIRDGAPGGDARGSGTGGIECGDLRTDLS